MLNGEKNALAPRYAWVILAVTFLAGITAPLNMSKGTALAAVIMDTYGIDASVLGWIIAMFYVLGFVLAFPSAKIIKVLGIRKVISIALLFGAAGSLLGATVHNLAVFMASRMLEGAGLGILGVAGASAIAPWFPPSRRGLAIGTWSMRFPAASVLVPPLIGWLVGVRSLPYTAIWWGTLIFDLLALVVFNIFYREPEGAAVPGTGSGTSLDLRRVLKNKSLVALALAFFFCECASLGAGGFLTTYLQKELGRHTPLCHLHIITLNAVVMAVTAPLSGKISDALRSRKKCLIAGFVVGILYMSLLFNLKVPWHYYPLSLLAGFFGGGVPAVVWAVVPEIVRREDLPAANAVVAFFQNLVMSSRRGAGHRHAAAAGRRDFHRIVPCCALPAHRPVRDERP
jgi:MFS family permease